MKKGEEMVRIGFAWCVNDIDVHHSTDDFSIIKNLVRRDNRLAYFLARDILRHEVIKLPLRGVRDLALLV